MTNGVAFTNSRRRLLALCDISLQRNDLSPGKADSRRPVLPGKLMSSRPSTTLAVWSGTGLNEAADAAVERSLEVDARAPGGARGVAGVARCHPSVKKSSNFNELAGKTIRQAQSLRRKSL
jgi:hypothetical protein